MVTVIERGPDVAPEATVNCAVKTFGLATLTFETAIPAPAFTCDAPELKFVFCPEIVTSVVCPGGALAGDVHTNTGAVVGNNRLNSPRMMNTAICPRVTGSSGQ